MIGGSRPPPDPDRANGRSPERRISLSRGESGDSSDCSFTFEPVMMSPSIQSARSDPWRWLHLWGTSERNIDGLEILGSNHERHDERLTHPLKKRGKRKVDCTALRIAIEDVRDAEEDEAVSLFPESICTTMHVSERYGNLISTDIGTLEESKYCITSLYVNAGNGSVLASRPSKQSHEASTLVGLPQKTRAEFKKGCCEVFCRKALDVVVNVQALLPVTSWLGARPVPEDKRDTARAEDSVVLSDDTKLIGIQRDWNEEFQSCREFPHANPQERALRHRELYKVTCDSVDAAVKGAVGVINRCIPAINPTDPDCFHMYVHGDIFFSFAVDSDYELVAYASDNNDLKGTEFYQEADIPELDKLAMVIIPGILQGDKSDSLLYGSIDNGKKISWNESFHAKEIVEDEALIKKVGSYLLDTVITNCVQDLCCLDVSPMDGQPSNNVLRSNGINVMYLKKVKSTSARHAASFCLPTSRLPRVPANRFSSLIKSFSKAYSTIPYDIDHIPNFVNWCLDGPPEVVLERYRRCIGHYRLWNIMNGLTLDLSTLWGDGIFQHTTSIRDTFYFGVNTAGFQVNNIIDGREGWNYGFCNKHGCFEYNHRYFPYMQHENWLMLDFGPDYDSLAPDGHPKMELCLPAIQYACRDMATCTVLDCENQDSSTLPSSCGVMVQYTCEAFKIHNALEANEHSIMSQVPKPMSSYNQWLSPQLKKWMAMGKSSVHFNLVQMMHPFSDRMAPKLPRIPGITNVEDAMNALCVVPFNCVPRAPPDHSNARTWGWSPLSPVAASTGGRPHPLSIHFIGRGPYPEKIIRAKPEDKFIDIETTAPWAKYVYWNRRKKPVLSDMSRVQIRAVNHYLRCMKRNIPTVLPAFVMRFL